MASEHRHRLLEVDGVVAVAVGGETVNYVQRLHRYLPLPVRHLCPQLSNLLARKHEGQRCSPKDQRAGVSRTTAFIEVYGTISILTHGFGDYLHQARLGTSTRGCFQKA